MDAAGDLIYRPNVEQGGILDKSGRQRLGV